MTTNGPARPDGPLDGLAGRRVLVTGAAGFLGLHLCRALVRAGARVTGTLRPRGSIWRMPALPAAVERRAVELADPRAVAELVRDLRPELVLHAAAGRAHGARDPLGAAVVDNYLATAHLLGALAETPCRRLVHLGSSLEYGPSDRPHGEDDPLRPHTLRGATKAGASLLVLQQAGGGAVPAVVVRPFSVYGPWESRERLIPTAFAAALAGRPLPFAASDARRDLVYVDDVVDGCLRAAVVPGIEGRAINLGTGRAVSNREIVSRVAGALGRPLALLPGAFPPRPADRPFWAADPARARELLGWRPRHGLAAGFAATAAWARRHLVEAAG